MTDGPRQSPNVEHPKSEERLRHEKTARYILYNAHYIAPNYFPKPRIKIYNIDKADNGFYSVTYTDHPQYGGKETVKLDLDFPFSKQNITSLIQRFQKKGDRELFLSIGAGTKDYPKKSNADPREAQHAFFVSDKAYGIVWDSKNVGLFHDALMPGELWDAMPEETYLFNKLDASLSKIPSDTFDTIQMVNVISDPSASGPSLAELARILKANTGELLVLNTNTPDLFPLERLEEFAKKYGCTVERIFYHENDEGNRSQQPEYILSEEIMTNLQKKFHVDRIHFWKSGYSRIGKYGVIIRKIP